MRRRRSRPTTAFLMIVLTLAGLLGGCASDVRAPSFLLSADQVGGEQVSKDGAVISTAGPDKSDLLGGGTDADTVTYTRTRDGHRELVQLSAQERGRTLFDQGRREVEACIARRACPSLPVRFTPRAVIGLPDDALAFSSTYASGGEVTTSFLRSYTFLDGGTGVEDRQVMVSLLRTDGSSPSAADLRSLTAAQVTKVEKRMGGGSS